MNLIIVKYFLFFLPNIVLGVSFFKALINNQARNFDREIDEGDDIKQNEEYYYDSLETRDLPIIPNHLPICIGGFAIDSTGISFCLQDTSSKQRPVYEVLLFYLF